MASSEPVVQEAVRWLEGEADRIIRASRRQMDDGTSAFPPQVGIHYEAFWLRDYQYTLEGAIGSYSNRELEDSCRLFLRSRGPDGAGVDCVKFDGTPVYRPGYGTMGENPVTDGGPFTVGVGWHTHERIGDVGLLQDLIGPLIETMGAVPLNPESGLVHIDPSLGWDRCPYGFTDTVRKQGDVLFSSLLFVQACRQLGDLLSSSGDSERSAMWYAEAQSVADQIRDQLWDEGAGLFRAATVQCRQLDVWGSAFAVYLGVSDQHQSMAIAGRLRRDYDSIVYHGQVRHLVPGEYWDHAGARDRYQNGAFWATPSGWVVFALDLVDRALADRTIVDLVTDMRANGACEWIFEQQRTLPDYLASAALPLAGIKAMLARRTRE